MALNTSKCHCSLKFWTSGELGNRKESSHHWTKFLVIVNVLCYFAVISRTVLSMPSFISVPSRHTPPELSWWNPRTFTRLVYRCSGLDGRSGSRCPEVNSTGLDATTRAAAAPAGLRFICRWQTGIDSGFARTTAAWAACLIVLVMRDLEKFPSILYLVVVTKFFWIYSALPYWFVGCVNVL